LREFLYLWLARLAPPVSSREGSGDCVGQNSPLFTITLRASTPTCRDSSGAAPLHHHFSSWRRPRRSPAV